MGTLNGRVELSDSRGNDSESLTRADLHGGMPYARWRDLKMARAPQSADQLVVEIGGLRNLSSAQAAALFERVRDANMAIYSCRDRAVDRAAIRAFAAGIGLHRLDLHLCADDSGITALRTASAGRRQIYVPYSNRALGWHTDGYYNIAADRIHAVMLHCECDSASGGENALFDPEIAYIKLREENPGFIDALTHPQCMTIPANREQGREIRPARSGPVFSLDPVSGALHMRYTARSKSVVWRDDATTRAAVSHLNGLLADENGPALRYRLAPGQGIISNNVLHNRTAYDDGPARERIIYRARFFDRLRATTG